MDSLRWKPDSQVSPPERVAWTSLEILKGLTEGQDQETRRPRSFCDPHRDAMKSSEPYVSTVTWIRGFCFVDNGKRETSANSFFLFLSLTFTLVQKSYYTRSPVAHDLSQTLPYPSFRDESAMQGNSSGGECLINSFPRFHVIPLPPSPEPPDSSFL
ncbi:hypothetical protein E5288_WYG015848 [Bos mutus]|uniref:Uncharacterized protein n=1 Tax=Bos mutus TaxID=72004 RepID=A0A6B0RMW6_9CETA|nr:hypothetical protein [Bos mutus]